MTSEEAELELSTALEAALRVELERSEDMLVGLITQSRAGIPRRVGGVWMTPNSHPYIELHTALAAHPRLGRLESVGIRLPRRWLPLHRSTLVPWLLTVTAARGATAALRELHRVVDGDSLHYWNVVLFGGVCTADAWELGSRARLVPALWLEEPGSEEKLRQTGVREAPPGKLVDPPLALVIEGRVPSVLTEERDCGAPDPAAEQLTRDLELAFALLGATGLKQSDATYFGAGVPFMHPEAASGGPSHDLDPLGSTDCLVLEDEHLAFVRLVIETPSHSRDRYRIAGARLARARLRRAATDRAVELGVAFESLFGRRGEAVSRNAAARVALVIGATDSERQSIMKTLQRFYDVRCDAVHRGKLSGDYPPLHPGEPRLGADELLDITDSLVTRAAAALVRAGAMSDSPGRLPWDR